MSIENNIDTIAYCWLVSGCTGAGGDYTNQYRPWYTTDTSAAISLVYTEGEDHNGNVVPYPTVEIAQVSTFQGDVKTFQVILHYPTPYWNPPTDPVFGYIRFKMSTVPPPEITVYLNGYEPTGETNYYISRNYTPVLTNVTYGDARTGKVRFAAITENPANAIPVTVRVSMQSDPSKQGEAVIPVVEQSLTIVMEEPFEVRPLIPTENNVPAMTALRRKPFQVRMTRNHAAVPNHPIRLYTDYVVGSGGHVHSNNNFRRSDHHDNYGYFTFNNNDTKYRPLDTVTNTDGILNVNYNASIFGDSMRIIATSSNTAETRILRDTIIIQEKVSGLINFREVPSNNIWDFSQSGTGIVNHPDNNWCSSDMRDRLRTAIQIFSTWSKDSLGNPIVLSLNDMSLMFGGRFDINSQWGARSDGFHKLHRNGISVDINDNRIHKIKVNDPINDPENRVGKWTKIGEKLKEIFRFQKFSPETERPIHFQLK